MVSTRLGQGQPGKGTASGQSSDLALSARRPHKPTLQGCSCYIGSDRSAEGAERGLLPRGSTPADTSDGH